MGHVEWLVVNLLDQALCSYHELRETLALYGLYELENLSLGHEDPLVRLRAGLLLVALDRNTAGEVLYSMATEDEDESVRAGAIEEHHRLGWSLEPPVLPE